MNIKGSTGFSGRVKVAGNQELAAEQSAEPRTDKLKSPLRRYQPRVGRPLRNRGAASAQQSAQTSSC